jgi:hypothetical protein
MFENFAKIGRALFIISMTKLDNSQCQHHILSPTETVTKGLQTSDFGLQTLDFGLQISH